MIDPRIVLFPNTASCENGHLLIGGCDVVQLASTFGTPLYVFDELTIRQQCRDFKASFKGRYGQAVIIAYAAKAFINTTLVSIVTDEGLWLDGVSWGEIAIAQKAGLPPEEILFHGNNKSTQEIELALKYGLGRFVVDNPEELKVLNKLAGEASKRADIILRINPGVDPHTHKYISTGVLTSKFGIPLTQAEEVVKKALGSDHINMRGLHFHIGSSIHDVEPYLTAVDIILELAKKIKDNYGFELEELDIGGGFAIRYTLDEKIPDIDEYASAISGRITGRCQDFGLKAPVLILEPGRAIIGKAGVALYTAGMTKEISKVKRYVFIDGGMGDNIRPALYGARYEAVVANRILEKSTQMVSIAGRYCESGDVLIDNIMLPQIEAGDIIAVPAAGAYCIPLSSNYNAVPRPAVVLVSEGRARLIRRRELLKDLMACDVMESDV